MKMEIKMTSIEDLVPNDQNPRHITKHELNKLKRSIQEFGFVDPIIVNQHPERLNVVVGGHQRLEAAKALDIKEVPVVHVNMPKNKEHMLNIALNKISGDWDEERLYEMLKELNEQKEDITLTGFDELTFDEMQAEEQENDELIDVLPQPRKETYIEHGDVYLLGRHRLMCGDSTDENDFKKLMGKTKADLCWTDPPYGVSYKGTNNPNGKEWGVMNNDEMRGDELYDFLTAMFRNVIQYTKDNTALYCCYASSNTQIFQKAFEDAGYEEKQQIIWSKGHVLGHSDYHWSHEPIFYCKKKDQTTPWNGDRKQRTVIMESTKKQFREMSKEELLDAMQTIQEYSTLQIIAKDPTASYVHATQKPVELSKRMIKNSSRPNEVVLEPFCGSGATLMACQTSNRICYAMELDPKYMQVILDRYKAYTGEDPIRESDKKLWSEIRGE
jgi:DNA modification methylase